MMYTMDGEMMYSMDGEGGVLRACLCGIAVLFTGDNLQPYEALLHGFVSPNAEKRMETVEMEIEVIQVASISFPSAQHEIAPFCFAESGGVYSVWHRQSDAGLVVCDGGFGHVRLYETPGIDDLIRTNLIQVPFSTLICRHQGIFMHGAVVAYQGRGIVLTASSGGGKSTHAALWEKHGGAEIINGDKAFLRNTPDGWRVYGSPWAGSSGYRMNQSVPLAAIISLEKGPRNQVRRLARNEAIPYIGTHVYYPTWNGELIGLTLDTLGRAILDIPSFLLTCRPDVEAMRLLQDTVFASDE